jgi:hypothetical protein
VAHVRVAWVSERIPRREPIDDRLKGPVVDDRGRCALALLHERKPALTC